MTTGSRMSISILPAGLATAFLHAAWTAPIKVGTSRVGGMVILSLGEVPIGTSWRTGCSFPPA
jgi:hypothetical protein